MPLSLFGIRTIALASAGVFVLGMSMFGMFVYLPLYLQGVLGMSAAASGTLFVPMIFAMIVASVASGQIVSRTGRYKMLAVGGAVLSTAGMALLAQLGTSGTATTILWCLVVCGFGFGAAQPVYALAVQNAAPRAQLGRGHGDQPVLPLDWQHHRRGGLRHAAAGHLPPAAGGGAAARHPGAGPCGGRQPAQP